MSESIAPKAAQNADEISDQQQDSSERGRFVSAAQASTHPPEAEDDDWLDDLDTVPAPRGSKPPAPTSEQPVEQAGDVPAPPSEPIVPAPIVNIAAEDPTPPEESKSTKTAQPESSENDAPSTSAQVVPISERRRDRKKKKPRPAAIAKQQKPERSAPVPALEPKPSEGFSAGPWLLLAAVTGVAGLWFLSRSGSEETAPAEAPPTLAAAVTPLETAAPQVDVPVSEPTRVEQAAPPPAPEAAPPKVEVPQADATVQEPSEGGVEPARVTAFKAVVEASKNARTCRHRGDAAGKVPVIVEFGSDGRVQRTDLKATFANPMTGRCIASRLSAATIPAFSSAPILITAEVSLR